MTPKALSEQGLSEPLPEFCLLNVAAKLVNGKAELTPGKLVCIAADKRILEASVEGLLTGGPGCNGCEVLAIRSGTEFQLQLASNLELTLQKRADEMADN